MSCGSNQSVYMLLILKISLTNIKITTSTFCACFQGVQYFVCCFYWNSLHGRKTVNILSIYNIICTCKCHRICDIAKLWWPTPLTCIYTSKHVNNMNTIYFKTSAAYATPISMYVAVIRHHPLCPLHSHCTMKGSKQNCAL